MGPSVTGFILLFIVIGVNSQDDAADSYTVIKQTGICEVCVCTKANVNCKEKNLSSLFSLEEWTNLTDIKPTEVDLSDNDITTVTAIAHLPIEELDLSKNKIESIDNTVFRDLAYLRVLDLSFNRLTSELSPHAFEGHYSPEEYLPLVSMRVLNLSYNDFHSLNQDLFEHLPELNSLDLTGNPLTTIDQATLIAISSLPMLKELRLRDCQLSEIPDKSFHGPRYLDQLDLSDNLLTSVPQPLEDCKNLVYLYLSHNPIEEMTRGFPRLPKLRELHMCNMPELTRIGQGALGGLERLAILHLSFNPKLTDIHSMALAKDNSEVYDWPIIKELYLQSNNLSKIDRQLVARWDLVEKMDISGNPFLCDSSTQWMVDELYTVVENTRVNGSETPVCQEPEEMRGYTMQYLHNFHRNMEGMAESEEDEVTNQPEGHEVMDEPEGDKELNQPEGEEVMNQPKGDEGMNQPEGDEGMNQPEGDEGMNQPEGDEGMNQPEGHEELNQPEGDEELNQPEGDEGMNQPEGDEGMNQPEGDEGMNQPEGDEVMNGPERDEVMNGPERDEVMDEPERERVIVPGTYIDILPWTFLAVPISLAMALAWRRKSSRRYHKLGLAEENYI